MGYKLGVDAKLYLNTGTFAAPVWSEVTNARDVTVPLEASEADASRRGGGGFKEYLPGLIDAGIEFDLLYDSADPNFATLRTAFFARAPIDVAAVDGDITTTGTQGLRFIGAVTGFPKEEPLEEGQAFSVTLKPTPNADSSPQWMTD